MTRGGAWFRLALGVIQIGGATAAIATWLAGASAVLVGALVLVTLGTVGYSFALWRGK